MRKLIKRMMISVSFYNHSNWQSPMTLRRLKSPQYDVQAAKFASEAGVIIREKIPILTHWKDCKNNKVK